MFTPTPTPTSKPTPEQAHANFLIKLEELWVKYWSQKKRPNLFDAGPMWEEMGRMYGEAREEFLRLAAKAHSEAQSKRVDL